MQLAHVLRLGERPRLALVGAGGKTTALFQIACQLAPPVLVTTTTHLAASQLGLADAHLLVERPEDIPADGKALPAGVLLFTGPVGENERAGGLDDEALARLHALAEVEALPLLIEADGARLRALKAPAEYEPAIPAFVETVVVLAGLDGLGKPLDEASVHRPERFGELSGLALGETITPQALARVLTSPDGGLRAIPPGARRIALLNQADTPALQSQGHDLAAKLLPAYHAVLVASLSPPEGGEAEVFAAHEPVAGIVLAAGGSSRLGAPKQLLEWRGKPFVRHVAETALQAGLSPVVVVTGAGAEGVNAALEDLPVSIAHNPDWEAGQSVSVKVGLRATPPETGGVIFLLVDQPQVPATLLRKLADVHAATLAPIVAPEIDGRRGNPILFDRDTFPSFAALEGDMGGRRLLSRYPVSWVPWLDATLNLDVDTPEDYQQLLASQE